MNKFLFSIATTVFMFSISPPSFALGGLEFLAKSPIAYFSPEDSRLFKTTLYDLLNNKPDGKTVRWANRETDHHGKMKSTRTFTQKDSTCRTIMFFNSAGGRTGQGKFNFCKQEDGSWKIAPR